MKGFLNRDDFSLGEGLGYVTGMIIFEVILAIVTGGAWAAVRTASVPLNALLRVIRVGDQITRAMLGTVVAMGRPIMKGFGAAAGLLGRIPGVSSIVRRAREGLRRLFRPVHYVDISTPYGPAKQAKTKAALAARTQVEEGAIVYRLGTTGKSAGPEGQFWALEHPLTPGFASRYGIPPGNVTRANFIEMATVKDGIDFITREAPGVGAHVGGGIEVVVPSGGVRLKAFSIIR